MALTGSKQDDLIVQQQLREMGDPLGPFHQSEELFISSLTDVSHWVAWLEEERGEVRGSVQHYDRLLLRSWL